MKTRSRDERERFFETERVPADEKKTPAFPRRADYRFNFRAFCVLIRAMAVLRFRNVGIRAIASCVPADVSRNAETLRGIIPDAEIEKTISAVGIREKRIAPPDVCASDLCAAAAEKLFAETGIRPDETDGVIFLSQTPDFRQPATAPSLQHRLGIPQTAFAFDVNLACSGYVYGLSLAFSLAANSGVRNVLLLVGETMSKTISAKDKQTFPLFGDAGTATLVSRDEDAPPACFSLNSDGSEADVLKIPGGGYRQPSSAQTLAEYADADGNVRTGEHLKMNGMDVFNFALRTVPADMKKIFSETGVSSEDIDWVVFHQANKMLTDFIAKRLKFSPEKLLYSLEKFGNTSSASIPLTFSETLHAGAGKPLGEKILISGFGAGLSWASALISLNRAKILPPFSFKI